MNNRDFWNSINKTNEHRNCNGDELVCDMMVKEGLGQTVDGYFEVAKYPKYNKIIDTTRAEPSQAFHFFEYYIDDEKCNRSDKKPSYNQLKCPQLIMYIAEMAGLDRKILLECLEYVREIEKDNSLTGSEKKANYLGGNSLMEFKKKIHICEIQSIISAANSYDEIVQQVSLIGK
ncbi:hypothetical protein [Streptococcus mitis]|uniref:hypothetical protein n=1 Tax=Streptococcus mitis TaxID=28037 RepID=UPI0020007231|nr:hypothetical protein [Streptococcus mitis]